MTSWYFDHQLLGAVHLVVTSLCLRHVFSSIDPDSPLPFLKQEETNSPGRYPFKFRQIFLFSSPPEPPFFVVLSSNPETTKPPTFRRSSPIRKPAVHLVVNRQLSVSDRPLFAALSSSIDSFFLLCVNCLFNFRCARTLLLCVFFYRPHPSIDTCHLLCAVCLFFNCRCAQPLSSPSVCRLRVFNFRCAFVFVIKRDTAISVKFLLRFIRISAFLRCLRRYLFCSSEAESYCRRQAS